MKKILISFLLLLSLSVNMMKIGHLSNENQKPTEITFFLEKGDTPVYTNNPDDVVHYVYI